LHFIKFFDFRHFSFPHEAASITGKCEQMI